MGCWRYGKADNLKPDAESCDEAARLQSLPVVIDWQRVDAAILEAADLGHLASGQNFRPLALDNLAIVRGGSLFACNFCVY